MLTKSELRALWGEYDFRPAKRLGQNFLIDKNIRKKILESLDIGAEDTVIEIGAGFGELTFDLAELAKEVFAVEKDRRIAAILKTAFKLPSNITLLENDFLDVDIKKLAKDKKVVVYGNLPYYITSPIIEKLVGSISEIKVIYLVVQEEVAERLVAEPGGKVIGRLSLYAQYHAAPERLFKIKRGSFFPEPEVDSAFLKLDAKKRKKLEIKNEKTLFEIIKRAYGQRRKTVLNSLSSAELKKDKLLEVLEAAKINPSCRAENLSLEDFARLANLLGQPTPVNRPG